MKKNLKYTIGDIGAIGLLALIGFVSLKVLGHTVLSDPKITIHYRTGETIRRITLTGKSFKVSHPQIKPGEAVTLRVHPRGESGLTMSFDTAKGRHTKGDLAYIESGLGYKVHLTIDPDYNIRSTLVSVLSVE